MNSEYEEQNPSELPELSKLDPFDGEKHEANIHRDKPLPKTCNHKGIQIVSATEARCGCGAGWHGSQIYELVKLFQAQ